MYATYIDDILRREKTLKWGNLKARDRTKIDGIHDLYCDPATRVIDNKDTMGRPSQNALAAALAAP